MANSSTAEPPPTAADSNKHSKQENSEVECRVAVAVHVRPLIHSELTDGCQECLLVTPGHPQV